LPEVRGGDAAFWDRWHIEECKNHFAVNPTVKDDIHSLKVREQYLYRCIQRAADIIRNGWKNDQLGDEVQDLWMSRNVGSTRFITENFIRGEMTDTLSLADIVEQYSSWCKVQEPPRPMVSDRKLSSMLVDMSYSRYLSNGVTRFRGITHL
jgi:phage/plasmid-associated DNA primase